MNPVILSFVVLSDYPRYIIRLILGRGNYFTTSSKCFDSRWNEQNLPCNVLWASERLPLYDALDAQSGELSGWNPDVLHAILQAILRKPRDDIAAMAAAHLRPYISTDETCGVENLDSLVARPPNMMAPRKIRPMEPDKRIFVCDVDRRRLGIPTRTKRGKHKHLVTHISPNEGPQL